uniref:NAD(P)/FAD-dependent oxidoreductase n=1 Tax=Mariniflexile sp. TaxID=1979402 RepID=UPI004048478F
MLYKSYYFHFHYEKKGVLMAFSTPESEEEEHNIAERAIKEGLDVAFLDKIALQKIQPVFSDSVIGAVHYKCDSHTTPNHFMVSLKTWLENNGATFHMNQEVKDFGVKNNKVVSVKTQKNIFEADYFVLASGCWTTKLAALLNLKVPIQGGKGYSMDVHRPTGITMPAILVEAKTAITPMDDFTRFAGTMEFSGNNTIIRKERVEAIAKAVKTFYKDIEINDEEKANATSGLRPVSPDGVPFIGKTSNYNNLIIAAGHAMMGWSLGPVTGKIVTELIDDKNPSINLNPLSPDRFKK